MFKKLFLILALLFLPVPVFAGGLKIPENVKVVQISCDDQPGGMTDLAYVHLTWDIQQSATSYVVYSRLENKPASSYVGQEVTTNNKTLTFDSDKNFYLAVSAVNEFRGTDPTYSRTMSDKSSEVFVNLKETCASSIHAEPSDFDYQVRVVEQQYLGGNRRGIVLSWNYTSKGDKENFYKDYYRVFAREASKNDYGTPLASTSQNSMWIGLNTDLDYYIRLEACSHDRGCVLSYLEPYLGKYLTPAINVSTPSANSSGNVTATATNATISNSQDNLKVEELNKKVIELQNSLEQSQKKQAETESRLNQIISWLKSIFPFFR